MSCSRVSAEGDRGSSNVRCMWLTGSYGSWLLFPIFGYETRIVNMEGLNRRIIAKVGDQKRKGGRSLAIESSIQMSLLILLQPTLID